MPNSTHSKKHPPKGFPLDGCGATGRNRNPVCINDVTLPGTAIQNLMNSGKPGTSCFLISRAYSEPTGHDMIESMLLQRDYIID